MSEMVELCEKKGEDKIWLFFIRLEKINMLKQRCRSEERRAIIIGLGMDSSHKLRLDQRKSR